MLLRCALSLVLCGYGSGNSFTVTPTGTALSTRYTALFHNWASEGPLLYSVYYYRTDDNGGAAIEIPITQPTRDAKQTFLLPGPPQGSWSWRVYGVVEDTRTGHTVRTGIVDVEVKAQQPGEPPLTAANRILDDIVTPAMLRSGLDGMVACWTCRRIPLCVC